MKIQYCSDLHLEFALNAMFLHNNSIKPIADTLILAGDITLWGQQHFKHWFFDYVSKHWERVYYIPGNHEFYSGKDLILELQPDYWIYGHHHTNMPETAIEKTKLVTNQLGYAQMAEHHQYRHSAYIDLG